MKRIFFLPALLILLSFGKIFSQTVYITTTGIKYHTKACKNVGPASQKITLQEALNYGKRPCSECHPPTKVVAVKKKKPVKKKTTPVKKVTPAKKPATKQSTTKTANPVKK